MQPVRAGPRDDDNDDKKEGGTMNPDCSQGKHVACSGQAWDWDTDDLVPCPCTCHRAGGAA